MRPRSEALLALGAFAALAVVVTVTVPRRTLTGTSEPRSSYLPGPEGARGLADALTLLRVPVFRYRRSTRQLATSIPAPDDTAPARLLAYVAPSIPLTPSEATDLSHWVGEGGTLLLAGASAGAAMRCFGFDGTYRGDSIPVVRPGERPGPAAAQVTEVLAPTGRTTETTTVDRAAGLVFRCAVPDPIAQDTLLVTTGRRLEAVRLRYANGGAVTLVADGELFSNRMVRGTDAGVEILSWLAAPGRSVYFDEYHHGFASGGDLAAEVLAWSRRSAWGWGAWQLAAVGILALLVAAIRWGPVIPLPERKRRSPLEHVQALATALSALGGHDVGVALIVGGLRRRLSRDGRPSREPIGAWVAGLAERVRSPAARSAVARLQSLITPSQPAESVLQAAYAVEDVWRDLRP